MKTAFTRNNKNKLSNYGQNALMQIVAACAVGFILAYIMCVIIIVMTPGQQMMVNGTMETVNFHNAISPHIALQPFAVFIHKPWILLTYPWAHTGPSIFSGLFNLLSNMMWLYCFGSVIQNLIGYKEIIPLFIISYILSGCIYLGVTAIWPDLPGNTIALGALPSIMAYAVGAITLSPGFKFYFGERFSIPLWVLLAAFLLLNVAVFANGNYNMLILAAGGALVGFCYIKLLKAGHQPGGVLYRISGKIQGWVSPDEYNEKYHQLKRQETFKQLQSKHKSSEESIDSILDKINMKGYDSLTAEEKDVLMKASKES